MLATLHVLDGTVAARLLAAADGTLESRSQTQRHVSPQHLRHLRLEVAEVERRQEAERAEVEGQQGRNTLLTSHKQTINFVIS